MLNELYKIINKTLFSEMIISPLLVGALIHFECFGAAGFIFSMIVYIGLNNIIGSIGKIK
jgi:hypothetical protein